MNEEPTAAGAGTQSARRRLEMSSVVIASVALATPPLSQNSKAVVVKQLSVNGSAERGWVTRYIYFTKLTQQPTFM
jgi:hypothetical protein